MILGATCLKNLRRVGVEAQMMMRLASTMLGLLVEEGYVSEMGTYIQT